MKLLLAILLLALSRAEILQRMRAPVVTQADGLVQVFADCPEDMRREFQSPIARFAADTIQMLYQAEAMKPLRFRRAAVLIHIGDVRTNLAEVVSKVTTNDTRVVTRIWLKSPGYADINRFRYEIIRAFYRSVKGREVDLLEAIAAFRKANPSVRIADERAELENWFAGYSRRFDGSVISDEDGLKLMKRVFEPGVASRRDVQIFASRLFFYPAYLSEPFVGRYSCLSFREAIRWANEDPRIRLIAYRRQGDPIVFSMGRSEPLIAAGRLYSRFLAELAQGKMTAADLAKLLDEADLKLKDAWEKAT